MSDIFGIIICRKCKNKVIFRFAISTNQSFPSQSISKIGCVKSYIKSRCCLFVTKIVLRHTSSLEICKVENLEPLQVCEASP